MAQLVLGVAGAALLGPLGFGLMTASTGFLVGSTIGSLLGGSQGSNAQGPRLNDLSVQASTYGTVVPVVYGSYKVNGNVIFCTDLREVSTTTTIDGKGGPTASQTTYSYNCDIAIALCDNQIDAILKTYNNGKLISDTGANASFETLLASSFRAESFALYKGTQTQLPDPTIEATLGVGNTPAFRGVAYVVFTALDCPNGQIPQLSFEVLSEAVDSVVVSTGTQQSLRYEGLGYTSGVQTQTYVAEGAEPTPILGLVFNSNLVDYAFRRYRLGPNYLEDQGIGPNTGVRMQAQGLLGSSDIAIQVVQAINSAARDTNLTLAFGPDGNVIKTFNRAMFEAPDQLFIGFAKYGNYIVCKLYSFSLIIFAVYSWDTAELVTQVSGSPSDFSFANSDFVVTSNFLWVEKKASGVRSLERRDITNLGNSVTYSLSGELANANNLIRLAPQPGDAIAVFTNTSGTLLQLWQINAAGTITERGRDAASNLRALYVNHIFSSARAIRVEGTNITGVLLDDTGGSSYTVKPFVYRLNASTADPVPLASVITDICKRAGLDAALLDLTDIADTITGYALTNVSTARANLDPLLQSYLIDPVKSNGKIKLRPRAGQASVATIGFDELGAVQDGSIPGEPLATQRTQEDDLPRSRAISYINQTNDYQTGTEVARRIVTSSINDQTHQLAVVMTSDRAASIANALMFNDWAERNKRIARVSRSFAAVDAGDVVTVEYPRGRFSPMRVTRASDNGTACEWDLVDYDGSVYTVQALGSPSTGQASVPLLSPTRLAVLDIPILRDADNNAGIYVAMGGLTSSWPGAVLYMGQTDAALTVAGSVGTSAVQGYAISALPDWQNGLMDQLSTVTVSLLYGELFNASRADVLTSTVNAAVLGNEIIQFTTATLVSAGVYQLSGLLRGLRGTARAMASHVSNERFVMLTAASLARPTYDLSELGQARQFRGVTVTQQISAAQSTTAINTGVGLKPFAPYNCRAARQSNGDIRITWARRTRLAENWLLGSVPLGERSQAYQVEVLLGGTLKRTLAVTTTQADYTLADQLQDSSGIVTAATVRIYQMSVEVGRGDVLVASITVAQTASDASQPASSFPAATENHLYPLLKAGSTLIAVATAEYESATLQRVFESSDDGVTFAALASYSPLLSRYQKLVSGRSDGVYISLPGEDVVNSSIRDFYVTRGVVGSLPVVGTFKFSRPDVPAVVANDGTKFYVLTTLNQLYTSTDGTNFTLQGTPTGLPGYFRTGSTSLLKVGSRWFIHDLVFCYYTTDATAMSGWTVCTMPADTTAKFTNIAVLSGNLYMAALKQTTWNTQKLVILRSTDHGSTFSFVRDTASYPSFAIGNESPAGVFDVFALGSQLVTAAVNGGLVDLSSDGVTWTSGSGQSLIQRGVLQSGSKLVVPALRVPRATNEPTEQLRYTSNGTTFTNSTGL